MVLLLLQLQQHLCCASLTRVMLRSSSRTICSLPTTAVSVPSSSKVLTHVDPHVLLGMSEQDLQQLAIDFGQQSYRGKQLHHLLYKTKAKEIQDFSHLPQAFRNDLQEAGYKVGRSPIHQVVTAADGTIKALIKLEDNRLTETVGIPVEDSKGSSRLTDCVSSQVSDFYKLPSSELNPTKAAMDESSHMFENRGGQLLGQIRHGSCRPRAILFKVLADTMGLESRLMVGKVTAENDSCDSPLEPNSTLYGYVDRVDAECLEQDEAIQPLHQRRLEASSNVAGPSLRNVMLRPTTSLDRNLSLSHSEPNIANTFWRRSQRKVIAERTTSSRVSIL